MKTIGSDAFTLIEVIVILTVAAIMGSMMYSYFSTAVTHSSEPIELLKDSLNLHAVNENITEDYHNILNNPPVAYTAWEPLSIYQFNDVVVSKTDRFGHLYRCIQPGLSGPGEPVWQTTVGNSISDGDVAWQVQEGQLDSMISRIREKRTGGQSTDDIVRDYLYYGRYGISYLGFIAFVNDREVPVTQPNEPRNLLKIILKNDPGESITAWFTTSY